MQLKTKPNIQPQCLGFESWFCHTELTYGKNIVANIGEELAKAIWHSGCAKPAVSEACSMHKEYEPPHSIFVIFIEILKRKD